MIKQDYDFINGWSKTYPFEIHELLVSGVVKKHPGSYIPTSTHFFTQTFIVPYFTKVNPFYFKNGYSSSYRVKVITILGDKLELYFSEGISFKIYNKEKELILL